MTDQNSALGIGRDARTFLEARGLDPDLCERLGVVSRPARDGLHDVLVFPFEKSGQIVNRKFRHCGRKEFSQDKGGEQIFWRRDVLDDAALNDQPLVITEGEFDCIAAIQAGFWRSVSVPSGAPAKAGESRGGAKYAFLEEARASLEEVDNIIIAADADGPGAALLSDLSALLGPARCRFVRYPEGCKDLNDVLRAHGVEGVQSCIEEARWVRVAGVYRLSDLPPVPPLTVWRADVLDVIDKIIPICPGHISVWTGIAGHGKSTLLNAVIWSIAEREGIQIAHGTFESTPQREYLQDLISFRTGLPFDDPKLTESKVQEVERWADEHIVFLNGDGYCAPTRSEWIDTTLDWFMDAATTAVVRHGCRIVVLDPWSQIDHEQEAGEREDQYIRRSLKRLKQFARNFDVHVAIIAHPAKPKRDANGQYQMPEGYEISGAAHWYNFTDLGVTVHRAPPLIEDPETGNLVPKANSSRVLIRVWKVKFHRVMNKPGDVFAQLDCANGRYLPAEHWEERSRR